VPAGRWQHSARFDQHPARFTAVGHTASVHGHHLVTIVPLRVRGLKTCGTIAPRQISGGEGSMAMATPEPRERLPHEHELAMRAGAHRTCPPWQRLIQLGSGTRTLRMVRGPHRVSPSALLAHHAMAWPACVDASSLCDTRREPMRIGLRSRPVPGYGPAKLETSLQAWTNCRERFSGAGVLGKWGHCRAPGNRPFFRRLAGAEDTAGTTCGKPRTNNLTTRD
jgi:hypothetical protein